MSVVRYLKAIGIWKRTVRQLGEPVKPGFGKRNMTKLFKDACGKLRRFFRSPVLPKNPWKLKSTIENAGLPEISQKRRNRVMMVFWWAEKG